MPASTSLEPSIAEQMSLSETDDKIAQKKDEDTDLSTRLSSLPEVTGPKKAWIDFEQFCTCFKWVFFSGASANIYGSTAKFIG